jgi:hypothetical protein
VTAVFGDRRNGSPLFRSAKRPENIIEALFVDRQFLL